MTGLCSALIVVAEPSSIGYCVSYPNLKVGVSSPQIGAPLAPMNICLADPAMNGGAYAQLVVKGLSQFSVTTPGYLAKSFMLLVTTVMLSAMAWAAISLSRASFLFSRVACRIGP